MLMLSKEPYKIEKGHVNCSPEVIWEKTAVHLPHYSL